MIPARPFTTLRYIDDGKPSRVCDDCKAALEAQEAEEAAAASPAKNPPPGVLKKNSVDQGSTAEGASGAAAASTPSENKQVIKVATDTNILDLRTRYRTKLGWFFWF